MVRTLRVLSLVLVAAAAVYMAVVYSSSPDRMPMQWNLQNEPTWYASKAAFFGMFAGGLLLGLGLTFVKPAAPVGAAVAFSSTLMLHACTQAATGGRWMPLPVSAATILVLGVSLVATLATVRAALKAANSPGGGAPPPARPRAS